MTIGLNNRQDYLGNGATATYSFNFLIFDDDDLLVTKRDTSNVETTLVKTTDYTVTGMGLAAGGSITLTAGNLTSGYTLTIRRVVPLVQTTDLRNQQSFFAEVHEDTFDYLMMAIQQLNDASGRSIRLPETADPATFDTELPFPSAGQILMWDPTGTHLINAGVPSGVTLVPGGTSGGAASRVAKFLDATTLTSSSIYDDGTSTTIGTLAASDSPTLVRFQVQKDANLDIVGLLRNNNTGTLATASWTARSGAAANDISIGVTSSGFTTADGIPASSGVIHTGLDSTGGLYVQTKAGSIYFQTGGPTTRVEMSAAGLIVTGNLSLSGIVSTALTMQIDQNASSDVTAKNLTVGATSRATFRALSNLGSLYLGMTSSGYTFAGGNDANQGFLSIPEAAAVNGLLITTAAGPVRFRPAHATVAAPANALLTLTADYALELTDSSTAAVGASGTVRLRNNAGTLEASQNGGAWAALSGGGGGSIGGSGTANRVAKFTAGTTLGNSTIFDDGTSATVGTNAASDDPPRVRFQVQKDQNDSTGLLVRNNTSGSLARAIVTVRSGSTTNDISMGITSPLYSVPGTGFAGNAGFLYTGAGTLGMTLQTAQGSIYFQPAGVTVRLEIEPLGLHLTGDFWMSGTVRTPILERVDQNESTYLTVQNANTGSIARALFVARSGVASLDLSMGVVSSSYSAGVVPASSALIVSGVNATAGMYLKTDAGSIYFMPNGTTVRGEFSSAGLGVTGVLNVSGAITAGNITGAIITGSSFFGAGGGLYGLNAGNLTGVIPIANGGTGGSSFAAGRIPYYNSTSGSLLGSGLSYNSATSGLQFLGAGIQVGAPTGGDKGYATINVEADIYKNNTAYTNPDYALEHYFTGQIKAFASRPGAARYEGLLPLAQVEAFAREKFYLPQLDYLGLHSAPAGIFDMADASLLLHEETFLHLIDLDRRLRLLEAPVR